MRQIVRVIVRHGPDRVHVVRQDHSGIYDERMGGPDIFHHLTQHGDMPDQRISLRVRQIDGKDNWAPATRGRR